MNPIYKFTLSANGQSQQAYPVYKDDLAIEYALEQGQEFYRGKLSGKLTFQQDDYDFIQAQEIDTPFALYIYISRDGGQTWFTYWTGEFWMTDCQFDEDAKTITVTPTVKDRYTNILAGMDREYDLISLAPEIQHVKMDKRPVIQIYVPGQTSIGCYLSGMWWEQECEAVEETDTVEISGRAYPALEYKYHFAFNKAQRQVYVDQEGTPTLPTMFYGDPPANNVSTYQYDRGGYRFKYSYSTGSGYVSLTWEIIRIQDSVVLWRYRYQGQNPPTTYPLTVVLQPVSSSASGTVTLLIRDLKVYARYMTDTETASGVTAYPIPYDDLVENNRNYHYIIGYYFPDTIAFSDALSTTPTRWGIYQPGQYYETPPVVAISECFPVSRSAWGRTSVWFAFSDLDLLAEASWRKEYILKDAYPLSSVISVLLGQIDSSITHAESNTYSRFLYGINPISAVNQRVFITPKSNLISAGYDQPAQKAPVTLKTITDMLRDCFRCYWFIDDDNRFRVEHISWFMRGGTYEQTTPNISMDLTTMQVPRNGKSWSYARNQYQFDKPEMPSRYQFGWMDEGTELFDGFPIDILSRFVNQNSIEQIDVSQFTSDVDYILLNPGEISKDGFVLLGVQQSFIDGSYKLPYYDFQFNGSDHVLQNAWVSFMFLQQYYMFDMPASDVAINGVQQLVRGIKKLKTQTIKFPVLVEPNLTELIKTELGEGVIQKMTINLSSRNANTTLKYDTE